MTTTMRQQHSPSSTSSSQDVAKLLNSGVFEALVCAGCNLSILDRYIMKVNDRYYHEGCLQCSVCSLILVHSCFIREQKLFCRIDYERLFVKNKCLSCGEKIFSDEFVMRTTDYIFHLKCFICVVCGVQLQKGDHYVVKQCQLFCRQDYEKEVELLQSFNYDEYLCDELCVKNNRRGPKRPRTILTTQQRRAFKACFDISPRPCRKTRETLANDTGLSLRIVQVWFQNQRAKMKKIEKKCKQKSDSETGGGGGGRSEGKAKDEAEKSLSYIKDEIQSDNESLVSAGSSTSNNEDQLQQQQQKILKHEFEDEKAAHLKEETTMFAHIFDGLRNKQQSEPNFDCSQFQNFVNHFNNYSGNVMGTSPSALGTTTAPVHLGNGNPLNLHASNNNSSSSSVNGGILNPIDRLYSMQNLYFCGEKVADDLN